MFLKGTLNWLNEVKRAGNGRALLPCLEGWKLSINSLIQLWDQLHQEKGFQFMLTNRLNQDCLEIFFPESEDMEDTVITLIQSSSDQNIVL